MKKFLNNVLIEIAPYLFNFKMLGCLKIIPDKFRLISLFSPPAVSTAMPQFHQMMGERLRTAEQGADTVVWLALSRAAARTPSGQFFQGEQREIRQVHPHFQSLISPFLDNYHKSSRRHHHPLTSYASVLQIVNLSQLTCLWLGLTALLTRFKTSCPSWRLWPNPLSVS